MTVDIERLIAALRDTAGKAEEKVTRSFPNPDRYSGRVYGGDQPETITDTSDRYSREWIAGRILGMADTLEAMLSVAAPPPTTPAPPNPEE